MDRNMFARTRYIFETHGGEHYVCSMACVVILSMKLREEPEKVKVAEYLHPESMIVAERAIYVIGSKARGTMTKVSKIAFSDRKEAETIVERYGGRLAGYDEAFRTAKKEVQQYIK
jgi:nitrous oxide reductase accessory protein NosL